MKYSEILEQGTIGSTPYPTAGGSSVPSTAAPGTQAGLSGNTQQLQNPTIAAAQLAQNKQAKTTQIRAIQQQIAALQRQLAELNRTG